jgi:hypothetical protein
VTTGSQLVLVGLTLNFSFNYLAMNCKLDVQTEKEEKPCTKNQGWEPIHQKYKVNENTSRHNPKKKTKANNQQKLGEHPMQRGLMA